jgi:hypothetical protein
LAKAVSLFKRQRAQARADRNAQDHAGLVAAVSAGRMEALVEEDR